MERAGSKKVGKTAAKTAEKQARKAHTRDSLQALSKLAEHVGGRYRIVSQPPVVIPLRDLAPSIGLSVDEMEHVIHEQFRAYRKTLQDDRRHLLEKFEVVDMAHKVVGVGSVGMRAFIVLLQGRDQDDPLFLQVKEATASVLEDHLPKSRYRHPGERVVQGQRLMQAASDIFLGWTKRAEADRYLYWRQLRDMKGSALVETMVPAALTFYARVCGETLARAHARSGDPVALGRVHGQEGSVRPIDRRLLRTLRRPERARLSGVRRGDPVGPSRRAGERLIGARMQAARSAQRTARLAPLAFDGGTDACSGCRSLSTCFGAGSTRNHPCVRASSARLRAGLTGTGSDPCRIGIAAAGDVFDTR